MKYFLFLFLCTKNPLKNELTEILIALINIKLVWIVLKLHYLPFQEFELYAHTKPNALYSIEIDISRKILCAKSVSLLNLDDPGIFKDQNVSCRNIKSKIFY